MTPSDTGTGDRPVVDAVRAWEARGNRIATPNGAVWVMDVPASDPDGSDPDPVLVLHGFPSSTFDWRHVLDVMTIRHRVVLFDCIGFGLSDKPDRRYSIELHADTAETVASHCGIDRVALVTHDMGDTVGGELLARELDGRGALTVTRRFLTNGSIYLEMAQLTTGQQLLMSLPDERVDASLAGSDDGSGFKVGLAATFSAAHPATDDELAGQWALMARESGNTLLTRTIRYLEDRREREDRYTGAIETHPSPLAVLWGALDPVAVNGMALRLLGARPDTTLFTLDDVGHWPMIEAPRRFGVSFSRWMDRVD